MNHNFTLTSPTIQLCPAQQKFPLKIDFFLRLVEHLQLTPINYARKNFSRPEGAPAPTGPPGYACVLATGQLFHGM